MNKTVEIAKLKKPLWRWLTKWSVRVFVVLVVFIAVAWSLWNYWAARSLRNEIERIKAAGEPITFRDLTASLEEVDQANDAGPFYAAATAMVRGKYIDWKIKESFNIAASEETLPSPELLEKVEQLLETNHIALELLDKGRELSGCDIDAGFDHGIDVGFYNLQPAKTLTTLNSLRTEYLAFQGKGDEASKSVISALRMLRMFDRHPVLSCHLVRTACMTCNANDIPVILEFGHPSPKMLQELENILFEANQSIDMKRVWITERVFNLESMKSMVSDPSELYGNKQSYHNDLKWWSYGFFSAPFVRTMALNFLKTNAELIDASNNDWPDILDVTKEIAQQGRGWPMFSDICIGFARVADITGRCLASTRSALVAVMIERYRQLEGSLPDSLEELESASGKKLPKDPFTGNNLIYRKTSDGYKVYSVGDDKKDDGGELIISDNKIIDWGVHIRIRP